MDTWSILGAGKVESISETTLLLGWVFAMQSPVFRFRLSALRMASRPDCVGLALLLLLSTGCLRTSARPCSSASSQGALRDAHNTDTETVVALQKEEMKKLTVALEGCRARNKELEAVNKELRGRLQKVVILLQDLQSDPFFPKPDEKGHRNNAPDQ
jgi:hypothetical protein